MAVGEYASSTVVGDVLVVPEKEDNELIDSNVVTVATSEGVPTADGVAREDTEELAVMAVLSEGHAVIELNRLVVARLLALRE